MASPIRESHSLTEETSEGQQDPNWSYWARLPGWRAREATALLLGSDPDTCKQTDAAYKNLHRLLMRAVTMGHFRSPAPPNELLEWAEANQLNIPTLLREAVARERPITNWRLKASKYRKQMLRFKKKANLDGSDDDPLNNPKSRKSLLTLLLFMAKEKYHYSSNRNSAATNIAKGLEKHEVRITEKTIRHWLQTAQEEVGSDFKNGHGKFP